MAVGELAYSLGDFKANGSLAVAAASFGGIQAMTPFAREFGVYQPTTETYALRPKTASLMSR